MGGFFHPVAPLRRNHPCTHDFSIEAGITYLDNEPVEGLLQTVLYRERYCLFVSETHELAKAKTVTWFDPAQLPLCLLTPNMQNRRIIDRLSAHSLPRRRK